MTPEPTDRNALNDDEHMEYNQIGDFYRHDDNMAYRFGSIILPTSLGAFGVSLKYPDMGLPLYTLSSILYLYWILFCERLAWFSEIRMNRAHELEEEAGLSHHRRINHPPNDFKCKLGHCLSIRCLRFLFFYILAFCWWLYFVHLG